MTRIALALLLLTLATPAKAQDAPTLIKHAQADLEAALKLLQPAPPSTTALPPGTDLTAAYKSAQPGTILLLTAGALYPGTLTIDSTKPVTFMSSGTLPAPDTRVTLASAAQFAKLQPPLGGNPAIHVTPTGGRATFIGLEVLTTSCRDVIARGCNDTIRDEGTGTTYDRLYIHGDPVFGGKRGIALNGTGTTVVNSYISDFKWKGQDSQALGGYYGPGPFTISNNYLEASGENILFGGGDPPVSGLVPSGIEIRGNTLAKPLAWRAQGWVAKNLFELKNARHVIFDNNVLDGSWSGYTQEGFAVVLTVRNQDGACTWCTIEDVKITNNKITNVGGWANVLGEDYTHPSARMKDVTIADNTVAIDRTLGAARTVQVERGPVNLAFYRNIVSGDGLNSMLIFNDPSSYKLVGFKAVGNTWMEGEYSIKTSTVAMGTPTLDLFAPGYEWMGNTVIRTSAERKTYPPPYPTGTTLVVR